MLIRCQFIDGPLVGKTLDVDLEQHDHTDRKTGAYYVRETDGRTGQPISYFRLHWKSALIEETTKNHERTNADPTNPASDSPGPEDAGTAEDQMLIPSPR